MVDKQARAAFLKKSIARFDKRVAALERQSDLYSWLRVGMMLGGVIFSLMIFATAGALPAALAFLAALVGFSLAVYAQRRINRSIARYKLWMSLKSQHIARINLNWDKIPQPPFVTVTPQHPFALDLDITGPRSISHLVNTAVSYEGAARLQEWLLASAPDPIAGYTRQKLVRELTPMVRFRDKLSLNALISQPRSRGQSAILNWLHQDEAASFNWLNRALIGLTALAGVNAVLWLASKAGLIPSVWQLTFLVYFVLYMWFGRRTGSVFATTAVITGEMERIQAVFAHLETYPYGEDTRLKQLVAPLLDAKQRPSTKLRQLGWILSAASIRGNALLWLSLNMVVPWDMFVAFFFQRMKSDLAVLLPRWLDIWFELEALGSLASFAHLNPEYTFPELLTSGKILRGKALGHPLIAFHQKVCNDYTVETSGEVDLITGSNMAGKSSFLRTLGVNLCLAYAGGPVNATSLSVSPFRLFSCIRVTDSVTDGVSYFYAEVKRLKLLLNALQQKNELPLFFLIDEIFRGTNNRERLIGSRAYIETLAGQNGVGLIATHDLELAHLADELPAVKNYHFEESVRDKQMIFDYKLRTGPSPTTNALKIMAMEGLPVPLQ